MTKHCNVYKDFFQFKWFEELQVGDVFKFCPIIEQDLPSKFYTAFKKDEVKTTINSTYGKELHTIELANDTPREIMIFPNRKRILSQKNSIMKNKKVKQKPSKTEVLSVFKALQSLNDLRKIYMIEHLNKEYQEFLNSINKNGKKNKKGKSQAKKNKNTFAIAVKKTKK